MTDSKVEIWAAVQDIYRAFLAGDTERLDSYIHPDATVWDAEQPDLVFGRAGLDAMRAARPVGADAPVVVDVVAELPVYDVFDDFAVGRHYITIHYADAGRHTDRIRNTGVWRRTSEGWKIIHNHEDLLPFSPDQQSSQLADATLSLGREGTRP